MWYPMVPPFGYAMADPGDASGRSPAVEFPVQLLVDSLPAMVGYWDTELRNRLANAAYTEWFGHTPGEILGMSMPELLGPDLFARNAAFVEAALRGERATFDRTLRDIDGTERHVQAHYVPDVPDGVVRGFFVLVTEITSRVEAHQEVLSAAEQYRALIRSMPAGFALLFDRDLRFTIADGEALPAFGYTREQLEGRTLADALPAELAAELEPRYLRVLLGETVVWERTIGRRVYTLKAGPVRAAGDEITGGAVVCTDVTEERRGAAIARALSAISAAVASEGTPVAELAPRIAQVLREIFALDHVGLMRVRENRWARPIAASPPTDELDPALVVEFDLAGSGMALAESVRTGRPALQLYGADGSGMSAQMYAMGQRVGASAPIFVRGELWGALSLTSADPDAIDQALIDRLESVSELVGIAIASSEAWEKLRAEATTDPVTGLANHRVFQERLAQGLGEARRDGRGCGLVLLDLDHFKSVNDTHGHPAGDAVLREVGRRLAAHARAHELAARIGGEEFALIIGGTDIDGTMAVAERARRAIADEPFPEVGTVTVSAGVAVAGGGDRAIVPSELIDASDRALYAAKRAGRNRVIGPGGQAVVGRGGDRTKLGRRHR